MSAVIAVASLAALAVPTAAMATPVDTADGYIWNEPAKAQEQEQGNLVGEYASQITHNGGWVQDQIADKGPQRGRPGVLAQDGLGRLAK